MMSMKHVLQQPYTAGPPPEEDEPETGHIWFQCFVAFIASISFLCMGSGYGWPAPTYKKFMNSESILFSVSEDQFSLIICSMSIGIICGTVIAWNLVDTMGRKFTLSFTFAPFITSWLLIAYARNVWTVVVGRGFAGMGMAVTWVVGPMYVGEITEDRVRGAGSVILQAMLYLGVVFVHAVGTHETPQDFALISCIFPLVFMILFIFVPESPFFLLMKNRREQAIKVILKLRRKTKVKNVNTEVHMLYAYIRFYHTNVSLIYILRDKFNRKPFFILIGLAFNTQLSGIIPLTAYIAKVFHKAGNGLDEHLSAVIVGVFQLITSVVAGLLIDRLGRRPLLVISNIGCSLSLIAVGVLYCSLGMTTSVNLLPLILMILYIIFFTIGLGPVPWALISEIFPPNVKRKAICIGAIINATLAVGSINIYHWSASVDKEYVAMWIFAATCGIAAVINFRYLPETKGKTFGEISLVMNSPRTRYPDLY